jgi:hypothetical protein
VLAEGKADISEFCGIIFRIPLELLSVDEGVDPEAIVKMTGLVKPDNWQASIIVMTDGRLGGCAAQIDGGVSPAVPAFVHGIYSVRWQLCVRSKCDLQKKKHGRLQSFRSGVAFPSIISL